MNRSTSSDDGERFVRDCLGGDAPSSPRPPQEPPPSTFDSRFEERRRWATTTLAAFGIAAVAGTLFAIVGARWSVLSPSVRAAFLVGTLATAHVGGAFAERRGESLLAHFLYCLGAAIFIGGVFALCVGVDAPRRLAFWANALPSTALLVFATAAASRSRTLHFFAAATFVAAFALDGDSRRIFAFRFADCALVCCAFGEYWAWRRSSLSVATVYSGVCVWTLVALFSASPSFDARALTLLGVFGFWFRWFGATFRSAFGATLGVIIAHCSLGLAAFPYFWRVSFATFGGSPFGLADELAATVAAASFVVFATRLIFDGARQNVVQFALAFVVFAFWLLAQCVVAALGFEENRFSATPPTVAALAFAALLLKIRTSRSDDSLSSPPTPSAAVALDALNDDREFDDLFDAEARAGTQTPLLSSIFESLDSFWERAARRGRFPVYVVSILAQAVALVVFARSVRTFF
ncbi:MAG: DUF2157 domain-containing protein [Thermoguttaceae bacterium]|nr:DUF2157 domain-containing protein [Thermoguttaceae bacterium]MBQ9801421.1 DUF2157 domain-containing protein [Thermoguttaceae bacterium]